MSSIHTVSAKNKRSTKSNTTKSKSSEKSPKNTSKALNSQMTKTTKNTKSPDPSTWKELPTDMLVQILKNLPPKKLYSIENQKGFEFIKAHMNKKYEDLDQDIIKRMEDDKNQIETKPSDLQKQGIKVVTDLLCVLFEKPDLKLWVLPETIAMLLLQIDTELQTVVFSQIRKIYHMTSKTKSKSIKQDFKKYNFMLTDYWSSKFKLYDFKELIISELKKKKKKITFDSEMMEEFWDAFGEIVEDVSLPSREVGLNLEMHIGDFLPANFFHDEIVNDDYLNDGLLFYLCKLFRLDLLIRESLDIMETYVNNDSAKKNDYLIQVTKSDATDPVIDNEDEFFNPVIYKRVSTYIKILKKQKKNELFDLIEDLLFYSGGYNYTKERDIDSWIQRHTYIYKSVLDLHELDSTE